MPPALDERRPAITPQLAVRVAALGCIAFVLFAIVFFRLWFLQVLTGQQYVSQARENRVRKVAIEAPRGDIVDRNDRKLVITWVAPVVQISPDAFPPAILAEADRYRIARGITTPLTALVDTAEAVTAGDLERRTDVQSKDELGRLGQAFNQMTEHLLRLYRTSRDISTTIEVAGSIPPSRAMASSGHAATTSSASGKRSGVAKRARGSIT